MKMTTMQARIVRILRDLDAVSAEVWERGFERELELLDAAAEQVSDVAAGFLDENTKDELYGSALVEHTRPMPGMRVVKPKRRAA